MIINNNIPMSYIDSTDNTNPIFCITNKLIQNDRELLYYKKYSEYCNTHNVYLIEIPVYYTSLSKIIEEFFKVIPVDISNRIKNKEVILGIYCAYEPLYSYTIIDSIYEEVIIKHGIPESQVLFICGAHDYYNYILQLAKRLNKKPIKLECFSYWQLHSRNNSIEFNIISALKKESTKKKFLFLNKYARPHRIGLACLLNNRSLLEQSHTSLLQCTSDNWDELVDRSKRYYSDIKEHYKSDDLKYKVPMQLDIDLSRISTYEQAEYSFSVFLLKYYYQTWFSVVTETMYNSIHPRYFTEKTFQPIIAKHPFILVTCPNSLESLRCLGFKTFHPLINEDYDLETNDSKRLLMIADEVERLCNLSESELKSFKEQALEIVEYNYNHLMTTDKLVFKLL